MAKLSALSIGVALGVYRIAPELALPPFGSSIVIIALAVVSTFVPSLAEDIITRGFWWRVPGQRLRGAAFVFVTSAIYVLNHIYRLGNGPSEWLMLFCFGIAYAVAVVRSGSLWAAVGVHWGWNLSNALLENFATVDALSESSAMISAGAHLGMALVILLLPRSRLPQQILRRGTPPSLRN